MSGQVPSQTHKMRRNISPPPIHRGPIKAVKHFILKNSPTRSPSSPTFCYRPSPTSPDRRSPSSPSFKVERPKAVRGSPHSSSLRRTSSLDTIAAYVKGQWPKEERDTHHTLPVPATFMLDKCTQTSGDWQSEAGTEVKLEKKKKKHRRSASFGHGDKQQFDKQLGNISRIRQKLQILTKDQGGTKQRSSPVPGNHNALLQTAPAVLMRSQPLAIHIPKASVRQYQRNSVEGLNPEIERLVQTMASMGTEEEIERIPDGHRAPVPQTYSTTRSVDTQTPSSPCGNSTSSTGRSSARALSRTESPSCAGQTSTFPAPTASAQSPYRPNSISPAIPIIACGGLMMENSPRPSSSYESPLESTLGNKSDKDVDSDSVSPDCLKKTASPKPNKIVREPPDGCEKIKAFDEDRNGGPPSIKEPLLFCPIKGQVEFKQSQKSAFCPLKKVYTHSPSSLTHNGTPASLFVTTNTATSIEGH